MKKQEKIIILIMIAVILATAGYFFYVGKQPKAKVAFSLNGEINYEKYQEYGLTKEKINKLFDKLKSLDDEFKKDESRYDLLIQFAGIQKILHEYDLALKNYLRAMEIEPDSGTAYAEVAELYVYPYKRYEEAMKYYKLAIEKKPYRSDYYRWLADLYVSKFPEKKPEIESLLTSGAEKNMGNETAFYSYLITYFEREGDIDKAIYYTKKCLKYKPDNEIFLRTLRELKQ